MPSRPSGCFPKRCPLLNIRHSRQTDGYRPPPAPTVGFKLEDSVRSSSLQNSGNSSTDAQMRLTGAGKPSRRTETPGSGDYTCLLRLFGGSPRAFPSGEGEGWRLGCINSLPRSRRLSLRTKHRRAPRVISSHWNGTDSMWVTVGSIHVF